MDALQIVPVGEGVPIDIADAVAAAVASRLEVSCHVRTRPLDTAFAWDARRNQYWSTAVLKRLAEEGRPILGLASVDLFVPVLTFVFGEAQISGKAALVSLHRLRNEFYGLPPNPPLLVERAIKEAMHELGHNLGLRHCSDWQCVMASSHSVEKIDTKLTDFCKVCKRSLAEPAV